MWLFIKDLLVTTENETFQVGSLGPESPRGYASARSDQSYLPPQTLGAALARCLPFYRDDLISESLLQPFPRRSDDA